MRRRRRFAKSEGGTKRTYIAREGFAGMERTEETRMNGERGSKNEGFEERGTRGNGTENEGIAGTESEE